jgi:hypothetical protein
MSVKGPSSARHDHRLSSKYGIALLGLAAVVIELNLRPQSPENGSIRRDARRLSRASNPKTQKPHFGDPSDLAKTRHLQAFLVLVEIFTASQECLADFAGFELSYSQFEKPL